ncbi:MAG: leucyl aminopeptidase [Acidimicrobiia bacterium]|nr:leucyl aminopeptidase [Acidimicrobiia bacterium]
MPIDVTLTTAAPHEVVADLLAVPVFKDRVFGPGVEGVDAALGGGLDEFMAETAFEGKPGQTLAVPTQGRLGAKAVVLVGLGDPAELTVDGLRRAAAAVAKQAAKASTVATTLLDAAPEGADRHDAAQAVAEGVVLGSYRFLRYKREPQPSRLERVLVLGRGGARVRAALDRGVAVAGAVAWARDMTNEPSAAKSPADFAEAVKKLMRGRGVKVTVLDEQALRTERLEGLLGVGQGSERPPRLVRLAYEPDGARGTLALVGKGVVFDSGGLSIKPTSGMEWMKTDMAGAAAVVATMSVLQELGVRTRVLGFVPLAENMPSGSAMRVGDVLTYRNGRTVEVLNTDAEGRLILADALCLAAEAEPDAIVDIATLTGACMVALGDKIAGLMGSHDGWVQQVRDAADRAGESVWPLPLPKEYRKLLDSEVADLRNIGTGTYGGAITAALFLEEFTGSVPWAHVDIAGPSRASSDDGYVSKGATGVGVRTFVELVSRFRRPTGPQGSGERGAAAKARGSRRAGTRAS